MSDVKQLFDVDRQFCKECQVDKEKAWMKYTAKESIIGTPLHNPYIDDISEIEQGIASLFAMEGIHFVWEPKHGFISDDETLGVTTGIYTRSFIKDGKEETQIGKYCTTWKKQDGQWRIVLDIGN